MQETQVHSLGWENLLEKEMEAHSSILAWRIPWTEGPGGLHTVHAVAKELDTTQRLNNNLREISRIGKCIGTESS